MVRKVDVQGRRAVVLSSDIPEGRQVRILLSDGSRSYTLSVIGAGVDDAHPDVRRFLDSVRFD